MSLQILESSEEVTSSKLTVTNHLVGLPLRRKEDRRLITGNSTYVDDIKLPGMLYAAVLRSPYSHAYVKQIDTTTAIQLSGVKLILTAADLPERTCLPTIPTSDGAVIGRAVLAHEPCFLGEGVAFVVAESRQIAEDALELVAVDYEILPSVVEMEEAVKTDSPKSHMRLSSNLAKVDKLNAGDVDSAFRKASKIIKVDYLNQRLAPSPIEPRSCLASFHSRTRSLTFWTSTQAPFQARSTLSVVLRHSENKIRVIGPEVGGAFGAKISVYPEDVLVCLASMMLEVPVKWTETRTESFLSMTHGRGQKQHIELASDENGKILGMKVKLIGDAGAYLTADSSDVTLTLKMICGNYVIPAFDGEALVVLTNKVLHDAYRGAARPEATYAIERAIDELAHELGLDPAEVRLRNFIPTDDFPYKTVSGFSYDSGDYSHNLQKALEFSEYEKWKARQRSGRAKGKLVGIGIACYVEICGFDPDTPQTASILVSQSGMVTITPGTFPHGQGHETPFAQIVADILSIPIEGIEVSYGDTDRLPWGTLTAGSRSAALGGTAVLMCAQKIKDKMTLIAAKNLGVMAQDVIFQSGEIFSRKESEDMRKLSFEEVAAFAYQPSKLPVGMEPVLYSFSAFAPPDCLFPFGTHIAVVEIEKETGFVKILNYVAVDDCGKVLNPLIVDGQVHGGIAQGLGQALLEGIRYDTDGQLLTSNFMDYQIPLASDVPLILTHRTVTPTTRNPLGTKGIGEAGTIAAPPALANAVADALSLVRAKATEMPLSLDYVYHVLAESGLVNSS